MEPREYIESGLLELYVFGLLDEEQNREIATISLTDAAVSSEIESIEKAIVNLSTSFSPYLSSDNFDRIREQLQLKHAQPVIRMKPRRNWAAYTGWAAAVLLMAGAGYLFMQLQQANTGWVNADAQKKQLQQTIATQQAKQQATENALAILQDNANTVVPLAGQAAAPQSYAKVYWNKETQSVYVDASGLPEPPEGKVYQIWSLKLKPQLTPTSIGLLENFTADNHRVFNVSATADADAFGITLEPAGGSPSPTMDQLYVLGKV